MSDLTIEEMKLQASMLDEADLEDILIRLSRDYPKKQVSLGHSVSEEEEARKKVDMLTDNAFYMIAYRELMARYQRKAEEAWRKFDDESEAYIQKVIEHIKEKYGNDI